MLKITSDHLRYYQKQMGNLSNRANLFESYFIEMPSIEKEIITNKREQKFKYIAVVKHRDDGRLRKRQRR